jgi:hypothetical protein
MPLLSSKTGSNGEMPGPGKDSDAEEDKQGYRSDNAPIKVIARQMPPHDPAPNRKWLTSLDV